MSLLSLLPPPPLVQGLMMWYHCRSERDEMLSCMEKWFYNEQFRKAVIEEYLNERSHFRQTGEYPTNIGITKGTLSVAILVVVMRWDQNFGLL